jgi:hypothetical protein
MGGAYSQTQNDDNNNDNDNDKNNTKSFDSSCHLTNEQLDFMRSKLHPDNHQVIVEDSFITDYYYHVLEAVANYDSNEPVFYESYGGMGNNIVAKRNSLTDFIELKMINFEDSKHYSKTLYNFIHGYQRINKNEIKTTRVRPRNLVEAIYY